MVEDLIFKVLGIRLFYNPLLLNLFSPLLSLISWLFPCALLRPFFLRLGAKICDCRKCMAEWSFQQGGKGWACCRCQNKRKVPVGRDKFDCEGSDCYCIIK
eukprot:TRINITY_DN1488_c0_g1_i2.p1 TRINITY_DN1488_c0_g1~~TRINITY_DN1488_c0_g1_i2.p1  ORF type:complete len:101 (-),score=10.99 TRINITY_DN1488_c0_g1_i2:271-573(-)